jgi:flagellar basal body-associated protein FliL
MENQTSNNGYNKRPMWQWIVIYLVIGAIVYGLIYYFVFAKRGEYGGSNTPQYNMQQNQSPNSS